MVKWCDDNTENVGKMVKKAGMVKYGGTIAFDTTNIAYYRKYLKDETIKSKTKDDTVRCASHMMAHTTNQNYNMSVNCIHITKDDTMTNITLKMLKKVGRIVTRPDLILVDRGFYSLD